MGRLTQDEHSLEELFEALLTFVGDPVLLSRPDGTILRANPAACRMLERTEEQVLAEGRSGLVEPTPDLARLLELRARTGLARGEIRFRLPDGTVLPAEITSTVFPVAGGEAVALVVFRDVSERRRLEVALREKDAWARVALDAAELGSWRHDLVTGEITFDERGALHYGFPERRASLAEVMARVHPDDLERERGAIEESLDPARSSGRYQIEYRVRAPGEAWRWLLVHARVSFEGEAAARRPVLGIGTSQDVTGRRALEDALRESEERFRAAFEALPDAVTLTDAASGLFLAVNEGARKVTGWEPSEMIGKSSVALGLWADADRETFVRLLRAEGAIRDFDTHLRRKDGSTLDVLLSARPIRVGELDLLITVTRDVSPQRRAERDRDAFLVQLRESQRLESVGRLAGGVAHDFNNLLTVILGCGGALEEDLRRGASPDPEHLAELHAAATRASELTRQLLAFSRRQAPRPELLDVGEAVRKMEKLLRRVLGEDVDLLVGTAREPRLVRCDPVQLEQVILNLAVNARDALPDGGKLRLETRNVELDERLAARFPDATPGPHVLLVVQDNGVGMAPEVRDRAFEAFYTTKPEGQGTGLGLATVHGIVTQLGGRIRLESAPSLGTKFELLLPASTDVQPAAVAAPAAGAAPGPGGSETLVVVEDDPRVREVAARILRQAGYRVLDCATGQEALALLDQERVALVLSDVVMPGMNGRQLADRIRERPAPPRLLFMSGHPEPVVHRRGLLDPGAPLLLKPFDAGTLLARLREVLDAEVPVTPPGRAGGRSG